MRPNQKYFKYFTDIHVFTLSSPYTRLSAFRPFIKIHVTSHEKDENDGYRLMSYSSAGLSRSLPFSSVCVQKMFACSVIFHHFQYSLVNVHVTTGPQSLRYIYTWAFHRVNRFDELTRPCLVGVWQVLSQ